jgi:O-antigen/teichoic acid export membrane protein
MLVLVQKELDNLREGVRKNEAACPRPLISKYRASFFGDLFETFGVNALLVMLGAFTSIFIARILGAEMRGEFALILLWSSIFSTSASLGINESLAYFVGVKKKERWKYLYTALVMTALITLLLMTPLVHSISFLMKTCSRKAIKLGMLTMGVSVFLIPQFMGAQSFLQGSGLIRHLNLINLSNGFFYFLIVLVIWMSASKGPYALELTTVAYITTFLIVWLISVVLLTRMRRRDSRLSREERLSFSRAKMKELLAYGVPLTSANIVNMVSSKLDQIFLSFLVAPQLIGFYVVALSTAVGVNGSALAVSTIALPRVTDAFNLVEKAAVVRRLFLTYLYSALPIFVLTLATVPYLIPTIFGSEFSGAITASQIIVAGTVFVGANQVGITVLKGLGLPKHVVICRVLTLGMLTICLSILIPRSGIIGAGWAIVVANIAATALTTVLIGRVVRVKLVDMVVPNREDIRAALGWVMHLLPVGARCRSRHGHDLGEVQGNGSEDL